MSNLNSNFKKIIQDLESNIKDKETLEYVKVQIFKMYNLFLDEIYKMEERTTLNFSEILKRQEQLEKKVIKLETNISNIEKDIYINDEDELNIICPYCNNEFIIDSEEINDEIQCPECKNILVLDWKDSCDGDCNCEEHDCNHCKHEEDEDM